MKSGIIIPTVAALGLMLCGCAKKEGEPQQPDPQNRKIILNMSGPADFSAQSRAPIDSWNKTPVSVGYVFSPNTVFDRSLTVSVTDNAGELVNTGMEYPDDNSVVSFIGYHPAATPNAVGTVTYDLSKGDVDVMVSNSVSGSLYNTIMNQGDKLVFEHMLTRVTFKLHCALGQSYPEPVFGLRASASTSKPLNTAVTFDLAMEDLTFKVSREVFAGNLEGFVIPLYGNPAVVVEMMFEPDVPVSFIVASLTGDRNITINSDPDGLWTKLLTVGGERGKQYTVELSFSGEMILAQDITVATWVNGNQNLGSNQSTWW